MRLSVRAIPALSLLLVCGACYRLPLRVVENDASGYEDLGVPVIEAVEYTPLGARPCACRSKRRGTSR